MRRKFVLLGLSFLLIIIPVSATGNPFLITDSELTYTIDPGKEESKVLRVYGIVDETEIDLFASDLNDRNSGKVIESHWVKFNQRLQLTINLTKAEMKVVTISVQTPHPGLFKGNIFLVSENDRTILPLIVETKPMLLEATLISLAGIGLSILLWNLGSYFALMRRFQGLKEKIMDLNSDLKHFEPYVRNSDFQLQTLNLYLNKLAEEMQHSQIDAAEERMERAKEVFSQMTRQDNLNLDKFRSDAEDRRTSLFEWYRTFLQAAINLRPMRGRQRGGPLGQLIARLSRTNFSLSKYIMGARVRHILFVNTSVIFLGLVVGLGSLLQQDYVNGLRVIGLKEGFILFGMGVGIDVVKQIISTKVITR